MATIAEPQAAVHRRRVVAVLVVAAGLHLRLREVAAALAGIAAPPAQPVGRASVVIVHVDDEAEAAAALVLRTVVIRRAPGLGELIHLSVRSRSRRRHLRESTPLA